MHNLSFKSTQLIYVGNEEYYTISTMQKTKISPWEHGDILTAQPRKINQDF